MGVDAPTTEKKARRLIRTSSRASLHFAERWVTRGLYSLSACLVLAACLALVPQAYGYPYPGAVTSPTGGVAIADPTMITRVGEPAPGKNSWFLYGTSNAAYVSYDRYEFYNAGAAMAPQAWWTADNYSSTWAPDVRYTFNNQYYMYYSESTFGTQHSAIGLATSSDGYPGTWIDHGSPILTSENGYPYNAIDPNLMTDWDTHQMWLTFGSYNDGIYDIQVDPSTGLPFGPTYHLVQGSQSWIEGSDMVKWGNYYYLFWSHGWCCDLTSNYDIRVARSTSPTGPFYDESGAPVLDTSRDVGTVIMASHDWVTGPGGENIEGPDPTDGRWYMLYAYWDNRQPQSNGRQFGINAINWDANGWPYF